MFKEKDFRILNLEPHGYSLKARTLLESLGRVDDGPLVRGVLLKKLKHYDILVTRLGHKIDAEVLDAAPRLRTIVTATTGLNHIALDEAASRGIAVLSLAGEKEFLESVYATAEHTWALLLALTRRLPQAIGHVLSGGWHRDEFKGFELYGRTLGIIGLGRLGLKVARYGMAFGMKAIGFDIKKPAGFVEGVARVGWDHVLSESDFISIHANYTSENHGMIGGAEIFSMKKGAFLINTARGELIDEDAVLEGLASGHLGGAALDVLCGENTGWEKSTRLLDYARNQTNLIITPHIGGCTFESMEKTEVFMAHKLLHHYERAG